ncbi:hypothetical protein SADUNF_Sadunf09G0015800 [Salix dunnii]|uniref:Homeobox domain-containing protein n=1 Tax=Salix dunnii TaxID=1413687 RepID=A0A835JSJ5_9ROSI|nr:hypothetical protein SADUNF_Sadunf09G0015800 [Salix dunnii]
MQNKREMELGLSLGDAAAATSKPLGFMEKSTQLTSKLTFGSCMGLSIHTLQEDEDHKLIDDHNSDSTNSRTATKQASKTVDTGADPPVQLDLLPNTPVPRNQNTTLTTLPSDNGTNFEAGSSGNMSRGFDVNRFSAVTVQEDQDGATLSSSPPNSATSSFQMDFCIYSSKGGSGSNTEADQAERASSRASDEDENGSARKKLRLSKEQSAFLEESFKEHNTLTPKQKLALAKELNLRPRQVEVWTKLKQTEVDCEYLKRCCETLTEENRRLNKEIQELRALKTSNPFYMQLPATTLTMCPSCERVATAATSAAATNATTTTTTANNQNNTADPTSKTTGLSLSSSRPRFPGSGSRRALRKCRFCACCF